LADARSAKYGLTDAVFCVERCVRTGFAVIACVSERSGARPRHGANMTDTWQYRHEDAVMKPEERRKG
jgi:hypothetical protein